MEYQQEEFNADITDVDTPLKTRSLTEGNIICIGSKNLIIHRDDLRDFYFKELRSGLNLVLSMEGDVDTGVYSIMDEISGKFLRNNQANKVRLIILGDEIVDITDKK
jgi:hypothetical protein